MTQPDITIIGAGIIGLSLGWRLCQAGLSVTIFDQAEAGMAASWAAAGMLAPQIEAEPGEESLLPLLLEARALWPDFARELAAASGVDLGYRSEGLLWVAANTDEARRLQQHGRYLQEQRCQIDWLDADAVRCYEPLLSPAIQGGLYSPEDHQVDNRQVMQALATVFIKAGGTIRENTPVVDLIKQQDIVTDVQLSDSIHPIDQLVIASGAWSRKLLGKDVRLPVRPVKGQMLAVQMPVTTHLLQHVIWGEDVYLVPRHDGRLLIGATVEEQGFNTDVTAGGLLHLLRQAWEILPGIAELPVLETWAGLRPGSLDDAPIWGETPWQNVHLATGHYRNGILLAPLTARVMTAYLLTGKISDSASHYTRKRFGF